MVVNGFKLPAAYVQLCQAIRERRSDSIWVPRNKVDAYGRPWKVGDLTIHGDDEDRKEDTEFLRGRFREGGFHQNEAARNEPGFVADFPDASKLIWLGKTACGEPFCFDFGASPEEPSVIFWTYSSGNIYWRRVAPSFDSFIALFQPVDEAEPDETEEGEWTDEDWDLALPPSRSLFDAFAARYAQMSPEERCELEAGLWKEVESRGMSDEDRRGVEELLERLRASVEP